jgi:hypothetical protein
MLGLVTVAKVSGGGEVARGEFMRFFAEAAWYPTVPITGEVSWVWPEGRRPYFRGSVTSLTYEFAPS